jgi:hypothetical protein
MTTSRTSSTIQPGRPVRVVLWGVGRLGTNVLRSLVAGVEHIRIVGAVDKDPILAGRTLGDDVFRAERTKLGYRWDPPLAGKDLDDMFLKMQKLGVTIAPSLEECLEGLPEPADVVYHMTESVLPAIQPQLELALSRGLNVISAAESMFHAWLRYPDIAARLDRLAKANGVSITGCGINPGFVFDALVVALARISTAITHVETSRVVSVSSGPSDIDHVGFGLWPDEFREKLATGRIVGHMGMCETIAAVAERLGLPVDRIEESWQTRTSPHPVQATIGTLEPGRVTAVIQEGLGFVGDSEAIKMALGMYYGEGEPERLGVDRVDQITIEGSHRVHATIVPSSIPSFGAAQTIINATYDILQAAPGLHSMLDFSLGGGYRGGFRLALNPERKPVPGRMWLLPVPVGASD